MSGEHQGFPDFSLLDLTVTQQRVNAVRLALMLEGKSHTGRCRDTLAKASRRHVNARAVLHARMALKVAVEVTQRLQILYRKIAALCEN